MEDFDIKIQELEFKYRADSIPLSKFQIFADEQNPKKVIYVGSYDTYFSLKSKDNPLLATGLEFVRYRQGRNPELTIKIKTKESNNNSRVEIDLPLAKKAGKYIVTKFLSWFGFEENFEVYKDCYIYFYEKIDIVYYIVKSKEDGEVMGKFVEVEARKDAQFDSEEQAWQLVKDMEQKLSVLGISPANRLRKSMWEMFQKNN